MNHCVSSTKCKYALDKFAIQKIWLIQTKTNLTQDEIKFFEEAWFVLNNWQSMFLRSLFKKENFIPINRLMDEMSWPTSHNGKSIRCMVPFKMSNLHYNRWEASRFLEVIINSPLEVPLCRYGRIYKIIPSQNPNKKQYEVIIGNFPACTCLDFVAMMFSSLHWQGKWVP